MKKIKTIIEQMEAAGYVKYAYTEWLNMTGGHCICLYQKEHKNYFINCWVYDAEDAFRYSFELQLEDAYGWFDITTVQWFFEKNEYNHPVAKLKDVERLFRKIYNAVNSPKKR